MKKFLLGLILSISLGCFAVPHSSIQPIQYINDDKEVINICASFSINQEQGFWLTAGHCAHEGTMVHGQIIKYIFINEEEDLALFEDTHRPALKLAIGPAPAGEDVVILGYPHGSLDIIPFFGKSSGPNIRMTRKGVPTDLYNVLALPGDSGGPILDSSGRVVGLGHMSTQSGAAYGWTYESLKRIAGPFWEK